MSRFPFIVTIKNCLSDLELSISSTTLAAIPSVIVTFEAISSSHLRDMIVMSLIFLLEPSAKICEDMADFNSVPYSP